MRGLLVVMYLWPGGCIEGRYIAQAGMGQLDLFRRARPISKVLEDADISPRLRELLGEVEAIKVFAHEHALDTKGNYEEFVELERDSVVWLISAAPPLSLKPKTWSFPLVGSFPYLGWFDFSEALRFQKSLAAKGLDVYMRTVRAYSTGGWFHDPVLSTMISPRDDARRRLAHIVFHELTHANIIINDQSVFNESIASFVGDTLAEQFIASRYADQSEELSLFQLEKKEARDRRALLVKTHKELTVLYAGKLSDKQKLAEKKRVMARLRRDLELDFTPNNAFIMGFKTYNSGLEVFQSLLDTCKGNWQRFWKSIRTLSAASFSRDQQEDIENVVGELMRSDCRQ